MLNIEIKTQLVKYKYMLHRCDTKELESYDVQINKRVPQR